MNGAGRATEIRRIIVGADGARLSRAALRGAVAEARLTRGTLAGAAVPVGLNDVGYPVGAPKGTVEILSDTVLVGLGTVSVLGPGAEGAFALRRRALDRRAAAGWESAWAQVEPRWSGRR